MALVEIAFSHLQAILSGRPQDGEAIQVYGMSRVFSSRLEGFKQAADAYFVRDCHQQREAELHELAKQAGYFATRRNEVAHGVLRDFHLLDVPSGARTLTTTYFLVCPYYSQ